jgi:hypothetical protein
MLSLFRCEWWKFTSYEVRVGRLWPTPNAIPRVFTVTTQSPDLLRASQSFLKLVVDAEDLQPGQLPPPFERRLLRWCGDHGLLGLELGTRGMSFEDPSTWLQYSESVTAFLDAGARFRQVVKAYQINLERLHPGPLLTPEFLKDARIRGEAHRLLHEWLSGCQPYMRRRGERGTLEFVGDSLMTMLALRFAEDLSGGRYPRECRNQSCGELFTPTRASVAYCRSTCKETERKRRQRSHAALLKRDARHRSRVLK